jgi:hypothetical protein
MKKLMAIDPPLVSRSTETANFMCANLFLAVPTIQCSNSYHVYTSRAETGSCSCYQNLMVHVVFINIIEVWKKTYSSFPKPLAWQRFYIKSSIVACFSILESIFVDVLILVLDSYFRLLYGSI